MHQPTQVNGVTPLRMHQVMGKFRSVNPSTVGKLLMNTDPDGYNAVNVLLANTEV